MKCCCSVLGKLEISVTNFIIAMWAIIFVCCYFTDVYPLLQGCGVERIDGDWYRLCSGWVLHYDAVHVGCNAVAFYFAGTYLEKIMRKKYFLIYAIVVACLSEGILSVIVYPQAEDMIGGSLLVFGCIGTIVVLQNCSNVFEKIQLNTCRGNWLLGYAVLGNILVLPMSGVATVISHLVSAMVGMIIGIIFVCGKKRKQ